MGDGDVLGECGRWPRELGIADHVEFAGWRYDDEIRTMLSTADVCLAPDPPSPLNDVSTMIKIPEYMAMGKPVVVLRPGRVALLRQRGRGLRAPGDR